MVHPNPTSNTKIDAGFLRDCPFKWKCVLSAEGASGQTRSAGQRKLRRGARSGQASSDAHLRRCFHRFMMHPTTHSQAETTSLISKPPPDPHIRHHVECMQVRITFPIQRRFSSKWRLLVQPCAERLSRADTRRFSP